MSNGDKYGTKYWFDDLFTLLNCDPWGFRWRAGQKFRYYLYKKLINSYIGNKTINRALDIGCATGEFTGQLSFLAKNLMGIDISEVAIEKARMKFPNIDFELASLPETNLQYNSFDFITCLEMLNYMDYKTQNSSICEIRNLLVNDGLVLFSSLIGSKPYFQPNEFINLISKYFKIQAVEYYYARFYYYMERILYRTYRKMELIQLLSAANEADFEKWSANIDRGKAEIIKRIRSYNGRSKIFRYSMKTIYKIINGTTMVILNWELPVKCIHLISKKLAVGQAHIFVLAKKSGDASFL